MGLFFRQTAWSLGELAMVEKGGVCPDLGAKKGRGDGNGLFYLQVTWIGERKLQF